MPSNTYSTKYGRKSLGTSDVVKVPPEEDGHSVWIEGGEWFAAPTVDANKFGGHEYDNGGYEKGVRDCKCGAYMLGSSSAGPVDPFGAPLNPLPVSADVTSSVVITAENELPRNPSTSSIANPPAKSIEQLAGELAAKITVAPVEIWDARRNQVRDALIEFAQEIKRSTIEP